MSVQFPAARAVVPVFLQRVSVPSTNTELVRLAERAPLEHPDLTVLVTDDQTAGRGRLGRQWTAPAGTSLAISILVRPRLASREQVPHAMFGWMSLLAGLAMARAVDAVVPGAGVKWPNDVRVGESKVCGILAEMVPGERAVVVGAGLNVSLSRAQLPTPVSTSLQLAAGAPVDRDEVLADYLRHFVELYRAFLVAEGDPDSATTAPSLRQAVSARCETLSRRVLVELPGGAAFTGTAVAIDETGRLVVRRDGFDALEAVAAGDVHHLRYE